MGSYALTVRYVRALFQGLPSDEIGEVQEELSAAAEVWHTSAELRRFMLNPFIPPHEKLAAFDRLSERGQWQERVRNLLAVLVENERISLLSELVPVVAEYVRDRLHREVAIVETPVPLDDGEIDRLLGRLSRRLGVKLLPQVEIRPELIAGVRVRVGDTMYDATVAGRVRSLREQLTRGYTR